MKSKFIILVIFIIVFIPSFLVKAQKKSNKKVLKPNNLTLKLAKLPDLKVTDIKIVNINDECKVEITIQNIGNAGVPDEKYGKVGDDSKASSVRVSIGTIPPVGRFLRKVDPKGYLKSPGGICKNIWFETDSFSTVPPGLHSITAIVDENSKITELKENNNRLTKRLKCQKRRGFIRPENYQYNRKSTPLSFKIAGSVNLVDQEKTDHRDHLSAKLRITSNSNPITRAIITLNGIKLSETKPGVYEMEFMKFPIISGKSKLKIKLKTKEMLKPIAIANIKVMNTIQYIYPKPDQVIPLESENSLAFKWRFTGAFRKTIFQIFDDNNLNIYEKISTGTTQVVLQPDRTYKIKQQIIKDQVFRLSKNAVLGSRIVLGYSHEIRFKTR